MHGATIKWFLFSCKPEWRVGGIASRLRTGRSGVRMLIGKRGFSLLQNVQTGSGAHPASCSVGTVAVCPEVKRPGREVSDSPRLAIHLRLLPRLRICGTGRLLVLYAFMPRVGKTPPLLCFKIQTDWGSSSHQSNGRIVGVVFYEEQTVMENMKIYSVERSRL